MTASEKEKWGGRIGSFLVVAMVVAGTALFPAVADLSEGTGLATMLFLGFLGAIVAVQVIPGLMLFGLILKGICSVFRTAGAEAEAKKPE